MTLTELPETYAIQTDFSKNRRTELKHPEPISPLSASDAPCTLCIQQLFEAEADLRPDKVALVFEEQRLTYRELNQKANLLAHQLRKQGVGPESLVAIFSERSVEMVVGLLAILKAGGAYVPLDVNYPAERLAFMLRDSRAEVLLVQQRLAPKLPPHQGTIIFLDSPLTEPGDSLSQLVNPVSGTTAENLAYVMYTSGSTGEPKGVAIPHRGVTRLVKKTNYASLGSDEVFLQFAPISFDASTFEIWGPLLNGGRLVIMSPGTPSLETLGRVIREQQVTTLWLTAGLFRVMVEERIADLKMVRQLLAGGDVLPMASVQKVLKELPGCRLINGYGPTENTTFTCCHTISESDLQEKSVPIGRPIAHTWVYILGADLQPVLAGTPGELCVGGDGLARGYLNQPELTAQKFVPNPFAASSGERLYRSGDLCRSLPDGRIEFLGRIDGQVKICGFRIELGEIETVLGQHPLVRETVVVAREDRPGEKFLAAYFVARTANELTADDLRAYLKTKLPGYMMPTAFVAMEALPLTPNGKVDKRSLPSPARIQSSHPDRHTPPRTPIEEVLVNIWQELLQLDKVGVHDNFFELGGNSLLVVQTLERVKKAGLDIAPAQMLQHRTIAELAAVVTTSQTGDIPEAAGSSLVTLQANGDLPPLFFVHTCPGDVLGYMKLVHCLGTDRPCYGFQSRGLQGKEHCHTSLEQMAAYYVTLLRHFQPEGPYHLLGWCFGGNVAWEMAHQLKAQGQQVALLALLETSALPPRLTHYKYYVHRLFCLLRAGPVAVARYLHRKLKRKFKPVAQSPQTQDDFAFDATAQGPFQNREHVYSINLAATRKHKSRPYAGTITLFNGTGYESEGIIPPHSGFTTLAGKLELHLVPGDHRSVLKEPNVRILAGKINACLGRAHAATEKNPPLTRSSPLPWRTLFSPVPTTQACLQLIKFGCRSLDALSETTPANPDLRDMAFTQ
ncbi:MAG: non-ribosomal peptide synthase [Pedosphaera sp.]|nr:non-ribosomal peptide synthase [Pedosphaera sp.]